jgi:hypothetical protein
MSNDWDAHTVNDPRSGWVEVEETGWDALKVWCAGPGNRARSLRDDRGRVVRVICETEAGRTESLEPFTSDDLRVIEEEIDSYLADAHLPPLPHGYRWFLRTPDGWTGDLLGHIDGMLNPRLSGAPNATDVMRQLQPVMDDLYP